MVPASYLLSSILWTVVFFGNYFTPTTSTPLEKSTQLGTTCSIRELRLRRQTNAGAFAETLYEANEPILQLNQSNFDDEVFNKKKPPKSHFVEFYYSWCGHCRNFAPVYAKFAEDVKSWNSLVEISALNCALDYNHDVCEANRVERVPYLKYFNRHAKQYEDVLEDLEAHRSSGQLRRQLVDLLINDYEQQQYPDWPSLSKFLSNSSKAKEAWSDAPEETKHLLLIFERPDIDKYTSIEMLLDLFPQYPRLAVRRVKDDHPLTEDWDIIEFPSVAILTRGSDAPIYVSELRRALVGDVLSKLSLGPALIDRANNGSTSRPTGLLEVHGTATSKPHGTTTPETVESRRAKYYVSETDLLLATAYAIKTEVPYISKVISGSNFTNLTRFVDALKRYFPKSRDVKDTLKFLKLPIGDDLPRSERARRMFSDLSDFLASKNGSTDGSNGPSVTSDEWKAKILELEARHDFPFPNESTWQHCRGSNWKYRGYTCGLWSLFHTLTINAYLEDGLKTGFDPMGVLLAIRGYVGTYFGCTYCAKHFMEMVTDKLKMNDWVKYSSDVVMYLWRAHNTVNKRLAGDSTEDPEYPKRQFPPEFLCEDCQQQKDPNTDWVYRSVLRWMIQYYTSIRPHQDKSMSNDSSSDQWDTWGNLTNTAF